MLQSVLSPTGGPETRIARGLDLKYELLPLLPPSLPLSHSQSSLLPKKWLSKNPTCLTTCYSHEMSRNVITLHILEPTMYTMYTLVVQCCFLSLFTCPYNTSVQCQLLNNVPIFIIIHISVQDISTWFVHQTREKAIAKLNSSLKRAIEHIHARTTLLSY